MDKAIINLGTRVVNNYLIPSEAGRILIDTGYAGGFAHFQKMLAKHGVRPEEIRYVFLTHAHDDHAGFLNEVLAATGADVILHPGAVEGLKRGQNSFEGGCSSLPAYEGRIPTQKNKLAAKLSASVLFAVILSLILRYVNGCTSFLQAFGTGFLLWTVVNLWDALVLDILWFCHDPHFVLKGTEDMVSDYHDYGFHIKGFFIGEALACAACAVAAAVVRFAL